MASEKKGLDELAFTAHRHPRKPLVPLTFRHVRLGVEPLCQQLELSRRNLAALNAIEKVLEEGGRDVLPADLRHGAVLDAVEPAREAFLDSCGVDRVGYRRELFCEQP